MTKAYDIVALSAICVDIQLQAEDAQLAAHGIKKGLSNLVSADTVAGIIAGQTPAITPGSPGANVAAGVALRGGKAALIGKIANDSHGKFFKTRVQGNSIHYTPLLAANDETATTALVVMTTPDKERSFAFAPGAGMQLQPEDIDAALMSNAKITYLDSYLWLTANGRDAVHHAATLAKQSGGLVALALNDAGVVAANQPGFLALAKSHADILVGDTKEFMTLFQTTTLEETLEAIRLSGKTASMTMGAKGAYVVEQGVATHVPANKIDPKLIVDTNGAGDQFAAGFLFGLAEGKPAPEAGRQGADWATAIIQHMGAEPRRPGPTPPASPTLKNQL